MDKTGKIVLDRKLVEVGAPVHPWTEHGMTFDEAPNVKPRTQVPDLIIWHWTGGENSASGTYGTLINRNLGVSFCIDRDGIIWQYCDPVIFDPRDTGGAIGRRSISLEVTNYGFRLKKQPVPRRGKDRIHDDERIHGMKLRVARFYPRQIDSIAALTKVLCSELNIPRKFPREKDGTIAFRELTNHEKQSFKGIIGHFHKTRKKADPGFHLFRELEHLEDTAA